MGNTTSLKMGVLPVFLFLGRKERVIASLLPLLVLVSVLD